MAHISKENMYSCAAHGALRSDESSGAACFCFQTLTSEVALVKSCETTRCGDVRHRLYTSNGFSQKQYCFQRTEISYRKACKH